MADICVLQHVQCEDLGIIEQILPAYGLTPYYVRVFAGEPVPKRLKNAVGLIIMGGPMSVYEHRQYPFLLDEMRLIDQAFKAEKSVLGICLGSQLLAAALGAEVKQGAQKEIGWYEVELNAAAQKDPLWAGVEPRFMGYHWHGDIFSLPQSAVSLASSQLTEHQAFVYGDRIYGLLFHMEVTEKSVKEMVTIFADELDQEHLDGRQILDQAGHYLSPLQGLGYTAFQNWAVQVAAL